MYVKFIRTDRTYNLSIDLKRSWNLALNAPLFNKICNFVFEIRDIMFEIPTFLSSEPKRNYRICLNLYTIVEVTLTNKLIYYILYGYSYWKSYNRKKQTAPTLLSQIESTAVKKLTSEFSLSYSKILFCMSLTSFKFST